MSTHIVYQPLQTGNIEITRLDFTLNSVRDAAHTCWFCGDKATHTITNKREKRFVPVCENHKQENINVYR